VGKKTLPEVLCCHRRAVSSSVNGGHSETHKNVATSKIDAFTAKLIFCISRLRFIGLSRIFAITAVAITFIVPVSNINNIVTPATIFIAEDSIWIIFIYCPHSPFI